ncbi:hypothetical protein [Mycoplasma leonicaptivi]|uniref:hypothetical protein n=1 Tax=Mycoplasma leonicaptivi TaxID=36742 RepID=UPI0006883DF3|nr:hypothetical protein [Mycoplasma leonicaptivi]
MFQICVPVYSDHITTDFRAFLNLSELENVTLHGIEDSNMLGEYWIEQYFEKPDFKQKYFDSEKNIWKWPINGTDRQTQYFVPSHLDNVFIYWSSKNVSDRMTHLNFKNNRPFFNSDNVELKDFIFNTKSQKTQKRFSSYWENITGLDWKKQRDKVDKIKQANNKPSLIVLGSGSDYDADYFFTVVNKYHNQYNIFYKGHPGKNKTSLTINFILDNPKEYKFYDYEQNKNLNINTSVIKNFAVLESQIPSEELTTHHALEENGLYFDKWVLLDYTSSAIFGLKNNVNNFEDILGFVFTNPNKENKFLFNTNKDFHSKFNLLIEKIASKNILIKIKEQSLSKDEISVEDIEFILSKNSLINNVEILNIKKTEKDKFIVQFSFEYNPKKENNKKPYIISIPLSK